MLRTHHLLVSTLCFQGPTLSRLRVTMRAGRWKCSATMHDTSPLPEGPWSGPSGEKLEIGRGGSVSTPEPGNAAYQGWAPVVSPLGKGA